MSAGYGQISRGSSTRSGRDGSSEKTSSGTGPEGFVSSCETSTDSDMPPVPELSELVTWVPRINERGSSSSRQTQHGAWPSPRASDGERGGRGDLLAAVRTGKSSRRRDWPTPMATDHKGAAPLERLRDGKPRPHCDDDLPTRVKRTDGTGSLNPTWVEWLMGFPPGWTDLEG